MKTQSKLLRGMNNIAYTENGALSNKSTLSDVLDLFYHASARRGKDNTQLFKNSWLENQLLTLKVAFYTRDIRGGQGERETFRQFLRFVYSESPRVFDRLVPFVPVYGRWDDILEFYNTDSVVALVRMQLQNDVKIIERKNGQGISLLAKWMPSINTSSRQTVELAKNWAKVLGASEKEYRQLLSYLRKYLDIVERKISARQWNRIDYSKVPSYAMKNLRKAFSRHDADGFVKFLEAVKNGEKKINSSTLYPYDLVRYYLNLMRSGAGGVFLKSDTVIEEQWKALPNYADTDENALVIADVSGSMFTYDVPSPIEICISLAVYIAERNKGIFKDHFITFTTTPSLEQLKGKSLAEKVLNLSKAKWGGSTNLQSALNLILTTAVRNKLPESEMPTKLFIVSDMQFNSACDQASNFDVIKANYIAAGYKMPTIVFWNVASRNTETPVTMNENGVFLVSGASPSIFANAIKAKATNPYEMMLEVLNSDRYSQLDKIFQ